MVPREQAGGGVHAGHGQFRSGTVQNTDGEFRSQKYWEEKMWNRGSRFALDLEFMFVNFFLFF